MMDLLRMGCQKGVGRGAMTLSLVWDVLTLRSLSCIPMKTLNKRWGYVSVTELCVGSTLSLAGRPEYGELVPWWRSKLHRNVPTFQQLFTLHLLPYHLLTIMLETDCL